MLLIMAATSSVAIADDNTWEFDSTTEPGTLVIKGKGDLTTADQSTDYDVFTSAAVGNVFTNTGTAESPAYTSVTEGANYNASGNYFEAQSTWAQLFSGGAPTTDGDYVRDIDTQRSWITKENDNTQYKVDDVNLYHVYKYTGNDIPKKTYKEGYFIYLIDAYLVNYNNRGVSEEEKVKINCDVTNIRESYELPNYYATFTYNNVLYRYFVASTIELTIGAEVDLSSVILISSEDFNKYTVDCVALKIGDLGHVTSSTNLTEVANRTGSFEYDGNTYISYVVFQNAPQNTSSMFCPEDGNFALLTSLDDYVDSEVSYVANNSNLYVSTNNGTDKTILTNGTTYTYSSGETFWTPSETTYSAIENNTTYFRTTHPTYLGVATETITFKQALLQEIQNNSYTKVVFDNTESGALTIDPEIVQIINFPNNSQNTNLTNLDLGQATLKLTGEENFSDILENPGAAYNYSNTLAEITLPLVEADEDESVTLPSNAIPVGYDNASAALRTVTVPVGYTKIAEKAFALARPGYTSGYGSTRITTINLPEGLKEIGDEAFYGITNLTNINITDAEVAGRSIVLPSTVATIGESAFEGCTSLASTEADPFILPSGLKKIKKSAFINLTNLKFLELNEGLEYVGNTAFGLNAEVHDQTTITFPSTIKYLGPGSFISRWYQDIYFTGEKAPVCPVGKSAFTDWGNVTAFSANTQMGNNGFNPYKTTGSTADDASNTGYANRENYVGSGGYYFTILHFPDGLTSEKAKTYRDITRRYVACPEGTTFSYGGDISGVNDPATPGYTFGEAFKEKVNGKTSSLVYYMSGGGTLYVYTNSANVQSGYIDTYLGRQQIWPSQSQWQRNFVTVANGMEWDGETQYRPEVTEDMFTMMKDDGLWVQANSLDYTDGEDRIPYGDKGTVFSLEGKTKYASLSDNEKDYLSLILYQGTRRFVLSYDGGYDIPFIIPMQGGLWWSICLPFSLTKEKVDDIFGVGTHVCLMSAVDRTVTQDSNGQNTLVLKFKNDVYRHKTERTSSTTTITTTDENGKSTTTSAKLYTYASNFDKTAAAPGSDDVVIYARESYMIFPTKDNNDAAQRDFGTPVFETGNPLPTMVQVNRENGTFTDGFNQQYKIEGSDPVYRFIGNFTTTAGYETNNNVTTAVSVKIPKYSYAYGKMDGQRKFFILNTANATWSPFKSIVQNTAVNGGAEDWNNFFQKTTARVNQVSLFGDDEEITGIDNVIIEVSSDNDEDLRVFNLNGSMMGNSLQGLPAGTYIQGGKAYRVK